MDSVQYNEVMIVVIAFALTLLYWFIRKLPNYRYWAIPMAVWLLFGLAYSIMYIVTSATIGIDPMTYNRLNQWLRFIGYVTFIVYMLGVILLLRRQKI